MRTIRKLFTVRRKGIRIPHKKGSAALSSQVLTSLYVILVIFLSIWISVPPGISRAPEFPNAQDSTTGIGSSGIGSTGIGSSGTTFSFTISPTFTDTLITVTSSYQSTPNIKTNNTGSGTIVASVTPSITKKSHAVSTIAPGLPASAVLTASSSQGWGRPESTFLFSAGFLLIFLLSAVYVITKRAPKEE